MLLSRLLDACLPPRETEQTVRSASYDRLAAYQSPVAIVCDLMPVRALLPYREPLVQAFILEAKFHGSRKAQSLLGAILAAYLQQGPEERALSDGPLCIVPIPLSAKRFAERGHNQVERIVAAAAHHLGDTVTIRTDILARTRDTVPQTSLSGVDRRKNLNGSFTATGISPDHSYLLIDDVLTTGTTLTEAAQTLREAGARRIALLALAH